MPEQTLISRPEWTRLLKIFFLNDSKMTAIFLLLSLITSLALGYFLPASSSDFETKEDKDALERNKADARKLAEESKKHLERLKAALDREEKESVEIFSKMENSIKQKEEISEKWESRNKSIEGNIKSLRSGAALLEARKKECLDLSIKQLGDLSGLSKETALEKIKKDLENLIIQNKETRVNAAMEEAQEDAVKHAKAIVQLVAQRMATPSSVDRNSTFVTVKDDKFKGLLIGKNGNNITYFESLLPVAIIFNIEPDTIHVGGINLLRRNIAKKAIEKLQTASKKSGKIDFEMIKNALELAEKEIMAICDNEGLKALKLMGIDAKMVEKELINYVGRMYFRTSFGQNIIWHSLEMAFLARMISEQIGSESTVACEAAFYHDIGKAIDHDVGGAHDDLSKEILEKFKYDPRIVHAAFAHHDKVPCEAPEDFIVKAVDAISAVRPGARQESVSNYFERIKQLEETAGSFEGIKKTYAISAGREVRVIVDNEKILDTGMESLAEGIAEKISEELSFPGIIKVNLIRYTKSTDYAREQKSRK